MISSFFLSILLTILPYPCGRARVSFDSCSSGVIRYYMLIMYHRVESGYDDPQSRDSGHRLPFNHQFLFTSLNCAGPLESKWLLSGDKIELTELVVRNISDDALISWDERHERRVQIIGRPLAAFNLPNLTLWPRGVSQDSAASRIVMIGCQSPDSSQTGKLMRGKM